MIKTFLFDLGNVLVNFSHQRMCSQVAQVAGRPVEEIAQALMNSKLQSAFELGQLTEEEFHEQFEQLTNIKVERTALLKAGADIFWDNEPMELLVSWLHEHQFRLVLLSNTCKTHFQFIERNFGILEHFDDFVLSYEVGAAKPERRIFQAALARIKCAPDECFYTDDVVTHVEAGRRVGLDAEVFTGFNDMREQLLRRGLSVPELITRSTGTAAGPSVCVRIETAPDEPECRLTT